MNFIECWNKANPGDEIQRTYWLFLNRKEKVVDSVFRFLSSVQLTDIDLLADDWQIVKIKKKYKKEFTITEESDYLLKYFVKLGAKITVEWEE